MFLMEIYDFYVFHKIDKRLRYFFIEKKTYEKRENHLFVKLSIYFSGI